MGVLAKLRLEPRFVHMDQPAIKVMHEHVFKAEEWGRRTIAEQIYRCRLFAAQAHELSARSQPEVGRCYRDLAAHWARLAVALENTLKAGPV